MTVPAPRRGPIDAPCVRYGRVWESAAEVIGIMRPLVVSGEPSNNAFGDRRVIAVEVDSP